MVFYPFVLATYSVTYWLFLKPRHKSRKRLPDLLLWLRNMPSSSFCCHFDHVIGTRVVVWHCGHLTFLPANFSFSGALNQFEQDGRWRELSWRRALKARDIKVHLDIQVQAGFVCLSGLFGWANVSGITAVNHALTC